MSRSFKVLLLPWTEACNSAAPLRHAVFVEEQGVPEELEWDEQDAVSIHAIVSSEGFCVGTGRLLAAGYGACAGLGRMAVRREWRGQGVGSLVLQSLLKEAQRIGVREIVIHAQIAAAGFYRNFGFIAGGSEFQEAGIAHVEMRLALEPILKA